MPGIDSIRDEMAKTKDGKITFLGEGLTALIGLYPGTEKLIGAKGKTLSGCLDAIKKAAKDGVADPVTSTRAICKYYGLDFTDHRRLAMEVNLALCGGTPPEPPAMTAAPARAPQAHAGAEFDLDALLEGL